MASQIKIRALERKDLAFIHQLNNDQSIMAYWFEEPYASFDELEDLYDKHIHDNKERRFIAENQDNASIGIIELVDINHTHRHAEFQIIIAKDYQGQGLAAPLIELALDYAFKILNLNKIYLHVATNNEKAIHLYKKSGFTEEGLLVEDIFVDGEYRDVFRMYILQKQFLTKRTAVN